jgi:hypothetical protein
LEKAIYTVPFSALVKMEKFRFGKGLVGHISIIADAEVPGFIFRAPHRVKRFVSAPHDH